MSIKYSNGNHGNKPTRYNPHEVPKFFPLFSREEPLSLFNFSPPHNANNILDPERSAGSPILCTRFLGSPELRFFCQQLPKCRELFLIYLRSHKTCVWCQCHIRWWTWTAVSLNCVVYSIIVMFSVGGLEFRTKTVDNVLSTEFNETFEVKKSNELDWDKMPFFAIYYKTLSI